MKILNFSLFLFCYFFNCITKVISVSYFFVVIALVGLLQISQQLSAQESQENQALLQSNLSTPSPTFTEFEFQFTNLKDLSFDEALEIMSITASANKIPQNQIESFKEKIKLGTEKLQNYYKALGYRKVQVGFSLINQNKDLKSIIQFTIDYGAKTSIQNVTISGLNEEENQFLIKKLKWSSRNQVFTEDNLKKIQVDLRKNLNELGYYLIPSTSPQFVFSADETRVILNFKLRATDKYKIQIKNNNQYSRTYLENEILGLEEYSPTESNFGAELAEKLKSFYIQSGYFHAEINYYVQKLKNNTISLTLDLTEGPYTKINEINFSGQLSQDEEFYRELFLKNSSSKIQDKILILADIDNAIENLIISLKNLGFIQAKFIKKSIQFNVRKNKATLTLEIDEGAPTILNSIQINGSRYFNSKQLIGILNLKMNQRLDLIEFEKSLQNLKSFYLENGFLDFKITNEPSKIIQYSNQWTSADIVINISEGRQIIARNMTIEGLSLTHERVVRYELELKENELITPKKIEESISRLQKTGHFSNIEIQVQTINSEANVANSSVSETDSSDSFTGFRDIRVKVSERNPGLFSTGIGVTNENDFTFQGYLGVGYRNIGGWGRGASIRFEGNYNPNYIKFLESKLTLGYLEPYLLETRAKFRLNYVSSKLVSDLSIRKVTVTNQAIWSIEQDITSHITAIYEILNVSNFVDQGINREDEIFYNFEREDLVIGSTGPTLDLDYRDNILNPTKGHWTRLSLEYSSDFFGNHNVDDYAKFYGQTSYYSLINELNGLVWANSLRGGVVKNVRPGDFGVPFDKKGFILGGRSTVRGFESEEFFPRTQDIGASYKLKDKSTYVLVKSELRVPFLGSENLSIGLFYDGGQVDIDDFKFQDAYRDSVGLGLRYNTPVGPLNLEYAHKLDKKSYESEGAFHLSVGVF